MPKREKRWKDWNVIREVFLTKDEKRVELQTVRSNLHFSHDFMLVDVC